ncbi:uncharacterized protein LOC129571437 [Sitodiplosis mosellana]|uniref:uncharacterized protein LOC129571437 n=1 Tax=Sitodiplosis mosellana TaxID=263140 RepID=UPI0024438D36|nr:uncharacterized protein LOC129571437 [Sitodiplosis mosellana]
MIEFSRLSAMSAKGTKFSQEWLKRSVEFEGKNIELKSIFSRHSEVEVTCLVCPATVHVQSKGFAALEQHMGTVKHKNQMKTKFNELQQKLDFDVASNQSTSSSLEATKWKMLAPKEQTTRAELLILLNGLSNNCSLNAFDNLGSVLKFAISDSEILKSLTLNRTKATYILNFALGPYFYKKVIKDINRQLYFTLLFDETVNSANKKELQIRIRYFSNSLQRAVTRHLQTFYLGTATAKIIVSKLIQAINDANLSINNLLMLGMDGPKTNDLVKTTINNELLVNRKVNLFDIGSCNLHVVHNSFSKGLKACGDKLTGLIIQTFNWFDGFPARREKFENVCKQKEIECKLLIKHVDIRWLTLLAAAERFLYLLPAIRSYFMNMKKAETKGIHYRNISGYLRGAGTNDVELNLLLIIESATLFNDFLVKFQCTGTLIHTMFDSLKSLLLLIATKICKQYEIDIDIQTVINAENLLDPSKIILSNAIKNRIDKLKRQEDDETIEGSFKKLYQQHYLSAAQYLIQKVNWENIKLLRILSPAYLSKEHIADTLILDKILEHMAEDGNMNHNKLRDEYKLVKVEIKSMKQADVVNSDRDVDSFWAQFFQSNGDKYPHFNHFMKSLLSASHGQMDVERGFSSSSLILTEDRAKMSELTLNARINTVEAIRSVGNDVTKIFIDTDLIAMAQNARKQYQIYLDEEKKKREEEERSKQKQREAIEQEQLERSKRRLENDELTEKINEAKKRFDDKKSSIDEITSAAENMLSTGLKTKNFETMTTAQAMFDNAKKQREELQAIQIEIDNLSRAKRQKSALISGYFSKK